MGKPTDIRPVGARLHFLPVHTRMPLKFGPETVTYVTCARACVTVRDIDGREAEGWGETPLSVTWVWPSELSYEDRHEVMKRFCEMLAEAWAGFDNSGHPMEVGQDFIDGVLPGLLEDLNRGRAEPMPWLGALVCCSVFDQALHDAFGILHERDVYTTYNGDWMNRSLEKFLEPASGTDIDFTGKYPEDFFVAEPPAQLPAWHLVGGVDPLEEGDLTGSEPDDGHPVLLADWIKTDGLQCLKIKLRGNDAAWDYERVVRIGGIATANGVDWLTTDFNCTVREPEYVNEILDRLCLEHPRLYGMLLYVEQPFPYELEKDRIDTHSVSARKPLFLDESAHDWKYIRLGRELGWTGVALKTCKTQTGALLSACWAKAHGMTLMVQDLTNPMLAQVPHCRLAAQVGTIMGVETNAMQFYPEASAAEAKVHPGLHRRRDGCVDLSTLGKVGFGYRLGEVESELPPAEASFGG